MVQEIISLAQHVVYHIHFKDASGNLKKSCEIFFGVINFNCKQNTMTDTVAGGCRCFQS